MFRVLVVEASKHLRIFYTRALQEDGCDVRVTPSGNGALEQIRSSPPDLLVADTFGWDMDVARQVAFLVAEKHIPVLLNTAYSPPLDDVMRLVAEGLVIKSSDVSDLKRKIGVLLAGSRAVPRESR